MKTSRWEGKRGGIIFEGDMKTCSMGLLGLSRAVQGAFVDCIGSILSRGGKGGLCWVVSSCAVLEEPWGLLGGILGCLGCRQLDLAPLGGRGVELSWMPVGESRDALGSLLDVVLKPLGASWGAVWVRWGLLWASWGLLGGAFLRTSGGLRGPRGALRGFFGQKARHVRANTLSQVGLPSGSVGRFWAPFRGPVEGLFGCLVALLRVDGRRCEGWKKRRC